MQYFISANGAHNTGPSHHWTSRRGRYRRSLLSPKPWPGSLRGCEQIKLLHTDLLTHMVRYIKRFASHTWPCMKKWITTKTTHTYSVSLPYIRSIWHTFSLSHTHILPPSLSLQNTHTFTLTHVHSLSHKHSFSLTHTSRTVISLECWQMILFPVNC